MIVDLHAHYPMHLMPKERSRLTGFIVSHKARGHMRDKFRSRTVGTLSRLFNYENFSSGPRVTLPKMIGGDVGVALSVLFSPFDEMDLGRTYGSPPRHDYFRRILRQLEIVENDIATNFDKIATIAHSPAELDAGLAENKTVLIHCVEGGYHFGNTPETVRQNVKHLAGKGIAYITPAHLFYRSIVTNAPAIPFISDSLYKRMFPQPDIGLTELGRALIETMIKEGVLIDLSHMGQLALQDTFALLDELDPDHKVPLFATHIGYRFGKREYNLPDQWIKRIVERGGVIGLIFCDYWISEGISRRHTRSFDESFNRLSKHIDQLHRVIGSHNHTAIGSDLDGYIRPTLRGLEDMSKSKQLEDAISKRYGEETAKAICSENSLRVLRTGWQQRL